MYIYILESEFRLFKNPQSVLPVTVLLKSASTGIPSVEYKDIKHAEDLATRMSNGISPDSKQQSIQILTLKVIIL